MAQTQAQQQICKVTHKSPDGSVITLLNTESATNKPFQAEIANHVKSYVNRIEVGSSVKVEIENKKNSTVLTYIQLLNGSGKKSDKLSGDVNEQERKNRAGVLSNAVTLVSSLGYTKDDDLNDVLTTFEKVFDHLLAKVGSIPSTAITNHNETSTLDDSIPSIGDDDNKDDLYVPESPEEISDIDEGLDGLEVID